MLKGEADGKEREEGIGREGVCDRKVWIAEDGTDIEGKMGEEDGKGGNGKRKRRMGEEGNGWFVKDGMGV